jgi:2-polyprenyl-6-methoxyphenol hydroxylase-like FAD-dependent oxidoreductase
MVLLEQARRVRTRMRGMSILAPDGQEIDRSSEVTFSSGRLDSDDIELLREGLVQMAYEHTRADAEYLFGDSTIALDEDETGVRVDFAHGASRAFDLVIGADGLHSTVWRLAFGPEERFAHHLGTYLSVFSADNFLALDNWQMWLQDGDAGFGIMPVRDNTELRIAFGFQSAPLADDLRGGDALSGQGTSLAVVGAHVLAENLAQAHGDHRAAYSRYEQRMRPFVILNQALATENPGGPASEESVAHAKNALSLDS